MTGNFSVERARLVELLQLLQKALESGPERIFYPGTIQPGTIRFLDGKGLDPKNFPLAAAVKQAQKEVRKLLRGGENQINEMVDESIAPRNQLLEILEFLDSDVDLLQGLPASNTMIRKLNVIIADLGGEVSDEDDGPIAPNNFRWRGKVYSPIARGPYLALAAEWKNEGRCIDGLDLPTALGDAEALLADHTMPSIRRKLNDFFRQHDIPLRAAVKSGHLAIQDGPPKPPKKSANK